MASVNKIKELANQREYSLALEIVDSQDLSKSLNPQFLRLCGDIFSHAKRYKDARKVLLMAHRLAPESKRIIASMVELYLNIGYQELAQKYYDIYMFDADENTIETKQVKYAYDNAYKKEPAWLLSYLEASFHHNMDYEWSYKTYLLLKAVNRDDDAKALADVYLPTYKNTEFADIIENIENNGGSTEKLIYVYAKQWIEDDSEEEQELRNEEEKLLEADELRIHPKEAEITIMFEEMGDGTEELSKRKLKKLMKEQEKQAKEAEEQAKQAEENGGQEASDEPVQEQEKGLLKKLFKKNKKAEPSTETEKNTEAEKLGAENAETAEAEVEHKENIEADVENIEPDAKENVETEVKETVEAEQTETENIEPDAEENVKDETVDVEGTEAERDIEVEAEKAESESIEAETVETAKDTEVKIAEEEEIGQSEENVEEAPRSNFKFVIEDAEIISDTDDISDVDDEVIEEQDSEAEEQWGSNESDDEDADMRELHLKGRESKTGLVVSVDEESDDFAAESETIDDLHGDFDYSNPFESISAIKKEKEEHRFMPRRKTEFVFEEAQLSDSDADAGDIDEFVTEDVDDEFGRMEAVEEETSLDTEETGQEEYSYEAEKTDNSVEADSSLVAEAEEAETDGFEFDYDVEPKTGVEAEQEVYSHEAEPDSSLEMEEEPKQETYSYETENAGNDFEAGAEDVEQKEYDYEVEADTKEDDFEFDFDVEPKSNAEAEQETYSYEVETVDNSFEAGTETNRETYSSKIETADNSFEVEEAKSDDFDFDIEPKSSAETEQKAYRYETETEQTGSSFEVEDVEPEAYNYEVETKEDDFEFDFGADINSSVEAGQKEYSYKTATEQIDTKTSIEAAQEKFSYEAEAEQADYGYKISTEKDTKPEESSDYSYVNADYKPKNKLDFPVFKSSLFPEHNKEIKDVENNFHELMEEAQDKMQENLLKEEQMQKEAEALLASLGIDLGSVEVKKTDNSFAKSKTSDVKEDKASRDALKASLKIDSVKRDTLRKLKEYR
ncbi:MAG: hypothetical protein NC225_01565 [Clostridium sp.]|nr:hypothetical protein [Clostridium sp.]MCM1398148.1 hypothetical protein [Clostridium sp.]MCM1460851.1 hypothetical protein [Bacteroides sp.]